MTYSNAERQQRWRDKRNELAHKATLPLDRIIRERRAHERLHPSTRRDSVELLLEMIDLGDAGDREDNAELLSWLRTWLRRLDKPARRRAGGGAS